MKYIAFLASLLLMFSLGGCTASGPRFTQVGSAPTDKAVLYVYRARKYAGSAGAPNIYVNGNLLGKLASGGYFVYEVDPGEIHFSNEFAAGPIGLIFAAVDRLAEAKKKSILSINVSSSKVYFVEWMPGFQMAVRSPDEARPVISECSLLPNEPH